MASEVQRPGKNFLQKQFSSLLSVMGVERGSKRDAENNEEVRVPLLTTWQLVALLFFTVTGGPYGFEDVIGAAGGLIATIAIVAVPLVWSIPLALMTGELSCMIPESGGHILWVFQALGPFWSMFNCTLALACGILDNALYPALLLDYIRQTVGINLQLPLAVQLCLKSLVVAICTAVNFLGASTVGRVTGLLGGLSLLPFVIMSFWAIPQMNLHWIHLPVPRPINWSRMLSVLLWNTSGFDAVGACAGEVSEPEKTYPASLSISVLCMVFVYLIPSLVGLSVAPSYSFWHDGSFVKIAAAIGGWPLQVCLALGGAVSAVGLLVARLCTNSRMLSAMVGVHKGPHVLQRVSSATHTPWVALLTIASLTLALSGAGFASLAEVDMVLYAASTCMKFLSLVSLRILEPELSRPFCIPMNTFLLCMYMSLPVAVCVAMIFLGSPLSHGCLVLCFLASFFLHTIEELVLPAARRLWHTCVTSFYSIRSYYRDAVGPLKELLRRRRATGLDAGEHESILKDSQESSSEISSELKPTFKDSCPCT